MADAGPREGTMMGSAGRDRITDYPPSARRAAEGAGSTPGGDPCLAPLPEVELEDVATSDYFASHDSVPPRGTEVEIAPGLIGPRLAVQTVAGELVGLLPTRLNYLRFCLDGRSYVGNVTSASAQTIPSVWVALELDTP